jgi:hypothetical protein
MKRLCSTLRSNCKMHCPSGLAGRDIARNGCIPLVAPNSALSQVARYWLLQCPSLLKHANKENVNVNAKKNVQRPYMFLPSINHGIPELRYLVRSSLFNT